MGKSEHLPIALVACVKGKACVSCAAKEMYQSVWFKKARAYVEALYPERWYILSAKYGLLHPNTVIEPYELTLNAMNSRERQQWSSMVEEQIVKTIVPYELTILAGKHYREQICIWLPTYGYEVKVPMRGLGIGQQQQWLGKQLTTHIDHLGDR